MSCPKTDLLDPDKIRANLNTKRIGKKVLVFNSTSSTNDVAAEYAANKENDGLTIFAEEQTQGRGRASNKWLAGRCDSILCSVLLTDCPLNPELLCLTAAVAVAEAVGQSAKIKWPNDIILNGKKVSGILLELKACDYGVAYIIGVGINCHQQKDSFPTELQEIATSIDIENHSTCDRISLAKRVLSCLDHRLEMAQKDGNEITEQWRQLSIQLGHRLTLLYNTVTFTGNCIGVDPEKGLILQLDSGGIRIFDAAQTTITASG
jgi:BirA family biotin operon repressor/biotin-[acetyl-CoA-carboxylase] ligase